MRMSEEARRGRWILGVMGDSDRHGGGWELNSGPLEEQLALMSDVAIPKPAMYGDQEGHRHDGKSPCWSLTP